MTVRFLAATAVLFLAAAAPRISVACPEPPKCMCDCSKECPCGETVKKTKVCKLIKKCWNKKPCSNEKKVGKCDPASKQLVCHIPPGNPANAHTICIAPSAVIAHLAHGDYLGQCLRCEEHCVTKKCCKWVTETVCKPCSADCPPCICNKDAGPQADSFVPSPDSFVPAADAYMPPADPDTGPVPDPDSGTPEPDAYVPPVEPDAAPPAPDAGPPLADGPIQVDPDAGPPAADLEVITPDGPCDCPDGFQEDEKEKRGMQLAGGGFGCSMGNGNAGGGAMAFLLIGLLMFLLRRGKSAALMGFLGLMVMAASVAYAQPSLPGPRFQPSVGAGDYLQTTGTEVLPHKRISLGVFYNYSHRPLQILWADSGDRVTDVIRYRHNADVLFAIGLKNRIELGLAIPFVAAQDTVAMDTLGGTDPNYLTGGLGDIRLGLKLHMFKKGPFSMGAMGTLTVPTASESEMFGSGLGFAPGWAVGLDFGRVSFGANIGVSLTSLDSYRFQSQEITAGPELFGSMAGKVQIWKGKLDFLADSFISMGLKQQDEEEVPFEILGGLRAYLPYGLTVDAGAGPGITHGAGTPSFRIFAGLSWSPEPEVKTVIKRVPCTECDRPIVTRKTIIVLAKAKVSVCKLRLDPVYFDTDKHELLPQSLPILKKNLELLKKHRWAKKIRIEGHADWRASDSYNLDLGMRRAMAVMNYLINNGISPARLVPVSSGEAKPYASNKTDDGMSQNRRVEFLILDPKSGRYVRTAKTVKVIKR